MKRQNYTKQEVNQALNELVESGELKTVMKDGEIAYVEPEKEVKPLTLQIREQLAVELNRFAVATSNGEMIPSLSEANQILSLLQPLIDQAEADGRQEVIEWIENEGLSSRFLRDWDEWQAKLKEWQALKG